ncbi:MAG TPA: hypothetical protein VFD74_01070 [Thermoleophilia bacterium]|nr:hypothetical protein [Thermoleophilia bacterium]
MRVVVAARHGGPETLRVEERPDQVPGPGEVRVRLEEAAEAHRAVKSRSAIGKVMLAA